MTLVIKTTGVEDFLDGEGYIKALILGPPGAGKTRSAGFWPGVIFADCEKGRMSLADLQVPFAEITSQRDMESLLAMLKVECRKPVSDRRYRTLVIDTFDAYQRIVIQERLDAERKESLSGWGDWGYLDAKMTQFVARLMALPMNIIVNVHVKNATTGDDESRVATVEPKLKGDLRDQIAAEFDLVGYMGTYWEAENGERVLKRGIQWHPDPTKPILKDRSGRLPRWTPVTLGPDDFTVLFQALLGGMEGLEDADVVEELPTDDAPPPAPPRAGGPVPNAPEPRKVAPPAKKTAAKAAPPTTTPPRVVGKPAVPPAPKPVVPPAPKPQPVSETAEPEHDYVAEQEAAATGADVSTPVGVDTETGEIVEPAAEPSLDEATETAQDTLGAQVVSDEPAPDTTTASEDEGDSEAPSESSVVCGTGPGVNGVVVPGCGKEIGPDESADLVQIAMLKTRTHLCNACYAAHRQMTKK